MDTKSFRNWEFQQILGSGGFGQVELWREKYTNKKIALKKCLLPSNAREPKQMERWRQEIENMKNFNHPNIVKSEHIEEMEFELVLCMEFCNRGDLRKVLNKPENACGLIQVEVLTIMKNISSALQYLHAHGITHRDLKPENIVLHEQNDIIIYKLIDLGYAKELGNVTTTASIVGTFSYVAPELFWRKKYTCSVDYWSLGILLFEILTGYKPFIPYLENLQNWINSMKKKKYEEICAKEINGGIEFYKYIIYPCDLSENILNKMLEWFQVVFQWNPRQRGKHLGSDEVVVFSLLNKILPWKTIHIFSISVYRMDQLNIFNNITFGELQKWIEQKTSIPINEQIITDTDGNLLNKLKDHEKLPLNCMNNSILYVYKNYCLEVSRDTENQNIPVILNEMLVERNKIKDRSLLKQCYTDIIYVMRYEIMLYKHYIFALGIKLDITNEKLKILNENIEKVLPNAKSLLNEIKNSLNSIKLKSITDNELVKLCDKIEKIHTTINNLNSEAEIMLHQNQQIKKFFNNDTLLNNLGRFSKIYEDFLTIFYAFEQEKTSNFNYITEKVDIISKIFFNFWEQKETLLEDSETNIIKEELVCIEKKLHTHNEVIKSSIMLINIYKNKYYELLQKINLTSNASTIAESNTLRLELNQVINDDTEITNNIERNVLQVELSQVINDDTEIRDNIVLHALLNKYSQDSQKYWSNVL